MSSRVEFLLQKAGLRDRKSPLEQTPPTHRVQFADSLPAEPSASPLDDPFSWPEIGPDASTSNILNSFLRVYQEGTQAQISFIKDEQGLLLADTGASEDLSGAASRVGQALEVASDQLGGQHALGNAVIDMEGDRFLNLFWAQSPIGLIGVGSITAIPVPNEKIVAARAALLKILH